MRMLNKIVLVIGIILLFNCSSLAAEESSKLIGPIESRGLIRFVDIVIDDQVVSGCWTNGQQIKQKARLTLEQSGVAVSIEPLALVSPFEARLFIRAMGGRTESGLCSGALMVDVVGEGFVNWGSKVRSYDIASQRRLYNRCSAMVGPDNLNTMILRSADTAVTEFSADVIKYRRSKAVKELLSMFEQWEPMTKKKLMEMSVRPGK